MGAWHSWIWHPVTPTVLLLGLVIAAFANAKRPRRDGSLALAPALGAAVGGATVASGALAVETGGPGALLWMWLTVLAGLGFAGAVPARPRAPSGPSRRGKRIVEAVVTLAAAMLITGALQTVQIDRALTTSGWTARWPLIAVTIASAAVLALVPRLARLIWATVTPLACAVFVAYAGLTALRDPNWLALRMGDAWQQAVGLQPASTGVMAGGLAFGVVWASVGGAIGPPSLLRAASSRIRALAVGLAGLVLTASALVVLTAQGSPSVVVADGRLIALERHHSRGLRPSKQVGQTIVLPEDESYEAGKSYDMLLRSNPRGHRVGRLLPDENAVVIADWAVAEGVDTVIFRSKDHGDHAAWDVHVPVTREQVPSPSGEGFVRLRPSDPDVQLRQLIARTDLDPTPYIPLRDARFIGRVAPARSPDPSIGDHLAMFEPESDDRPYNPALHEFFRAGFRGPYPAGDGPRPPWGYPANASFSAPIGSRVELELKPDPRGVPVVRVNDHGVLELPPWDILTATSRVIVRHRSDPAHDIELPVTAQVGRHRIYLTALDPKWRDFRRIEAMPDYEGVFALAEPYTFTAEVHGDTRLPDELAGHRVLVPLHPLGEPQGPYGSLPYHPHPDELRQMGWSGPVLLERGWATVQRQFVEHAPAPNVALLAVVLLSIAMLASWTAGTASLLSASFGPWTGRTGGLLVIVAAVSAPLWSAYVVEAAALAGVIAALGVVGDTK